MVDGQAHEDLGTVGLPDMRDEGLESLRLVLGARCVGPHGGMMGSQVTITMRATRASRASASSWALGAAAQTGA